METFAEVASSTVSEPSIASDIKPKKQRVNPLKYAHKSKGNELVYMSSLLEIKKIPGKGRGYVAKNDIEPGTLLIEEFPLVSGTDIEVGDKYVAGEIDFFPLRIAPEARNAEQDTNPYAYALGMSSTNSFYVGSNDDNKDVVTILKWTSLFNHDFQPNVTLHRFYGTWHVGEKMKVYAMKFIPKGQELTLSYYGMLFDGPTLREQINKSHGVTETFEDYAKKCPVLLKNLMFTDLKGKPLDLTEEIYCDLMMENEDKSIATDIKNVKFLLQHYGKNASYHHAIMKLQHKSCEVLWKKIFCFLSKSFIEGSSQQQIHDFEKNIKNFYRFYHNLVKNTCEIVSPFDSYIGLWVRKIQVVEQLFFSNLSSGNIIASIILSLLDNMKETIPDYDKVAKVYTIEVRDFHLDPEYRAA